MAGPLTKHSPAEILQQLMKVAQAAGNVGDPTFQIYATLEPDLNDDTVTIYDTDGMSDGRSMIDGELWNHWGLQFRVRSSRHATTWTKANAIRNWLSTGINMAVVLLGGSSYLVWCVTNIGQIIPLGKNVPQTKRSLCTINARTPIQELVP
jgi:hypothetical protein